MGILTRRQGDTFVISSDRGGEVSTSKRAPRNLNEPYQVWTGELWSTNPADALLFTSLDDADEYVRANYGKISV